MLRLLAQEMRVRVWKHEDSVMAHHRARLASRVPGQTRMAFRIYVPGANTLSDLESGLGRRFRTHKTTAPRRGGGRIGRGKRRRRLLRSRRRLTGFNLHARHHAPLYQQFDVSRQPFLVIAHPQVIGWWKQFDRMAAGVDVPLVPGAQRARDRVNPAFPRLVKHRFVLLMPDRVVVDRVMPDRTHAVHAAHVVDSVHAAPAWGAATRATPIMASRVTSAATSSSVIFSVPAGLSVNTR